MTLLHSIAANSIKGMEDPRRRAFLPLELSQPWEKDPKLRETIESKTEFGLVGGLDCGDREAFFSLDLDEVRSEKSAWRIGIGFHLNVLSDAGEGETPCFVGLARESLSWFFDSGAGYIGVGDIDLPEIGEGFLTQVVDGDLPDVYSLNIYPPHLVGRFGLDRTRRRKAFAEEAKVLYESPGGTLFWEPRHQTEEFYRLSPTERLTMFGLQTPAQPAVPKPRRGNRRKRGVR